MTSSVTGAEAGLSGDKQITIALESIAAHGGQSDIQTIYQAVESRLDGRQLSAQGRASLRRLVNFNAVQAGFLYAHDQASPGWRITPEGRAFIETVRRPEPPEEVINVDTQQIELLASNTVRGAAFERYVETLLQVMYPRYTWYDQGRYKRKERGLDFIGSRIGQSEVEVDSIGVQVKLHAANNAPTEVEWLKFLAGCFARRVERALFVTSGRLTSEQHREAGEARVVALQGREEINRIAREYDVRLFSLFDPEALE